MIKLEFPLLDACLPTYSFIDIVIIMPVRTAVFDICQPLSRDVLASIIHRLNNTICGLDSFPTKLLMSHVLFVFVFHDEDFIKMITQLYTDS